MYAMARLEVKDEQAMIRLMLRHPPTSYTSNDWIWLTWCVYRFQPAWAKQGYFGRLLRSTPQIIDVVFDRFDSLAQTKQVLDKTVPILLLRDFATVEECEQLIELAKLQGWQSDNTPLRTVSVAVLMRKGVIDDPLVAELQRRVASLTGLKAAHCEWLNCVKYSEGEQFKSHYDYI